MNLIRKKKTKILSCWHINSLLLVLFLFLLLLFYSYTVHAFNKFKFFECKI